MNQLLLQLMEVQGEIKMRLLHAGLSQEQAHVLAGDLFDYIARSPVVTQEHRTVYTELDL